VGHEFAREHVGFWSGSDSIADADTGIKTMLNHVTQVVFETKGARPSPKSSFMSIGVDSLGAIFFISILSGTLGGLNIKPQEMFDPGVTVESFSQHITARLKNEAPDVLKELGIIDEDGDEGDVQFEMLTLKDRIKDFFRTTFWPPNTPEDEKDPISAEAKAAEQQANGWKLENEFEHEYGEITASNLKMMDGFRAVFSCIVLLDHFWVLTSWDLSNRMYKQSIPMFILLTGWGTALQFRNPLRFHTVTRCFRADEATPLEEKVLGYRPLPREPFAWKQFLVTRIVGLFPIMWLGLILSWPAWTEQDIGKKERWDAWDESNPVGSDGERPTVEEGGTAWLHGPGSVVHNDWIQARDPAICTALYVFNLNSLYRPPCRHTGPNYMVFSSCLWTLLVIFVGVKLFVTHFVQEKLLRWKISDSADVETESPLPSAETVEAASLSNVEYKKQSQNEDVESGKIQVIIPDFVEAKDTNVGGARYLHHYDPTTTLMDMTGNDLFRLDSPLEEQDWPAYVRSLAFRVLYNRVSSGWELVIYTTLCGIIAFALLAPNLQMKNALKFFPDFVTGLMAANVFECICYYRFLVRKRDVQSSLLHTWRGWDRVTDAVSFARVEVVLRYLPDLQWIAFGLLLSDTGDMKFSGRQRHKLAELVGPVAWICFLMFGTFLQENRTRNCFSRLILENKLSTAIGHCSYASYLLQIQLLRHPAWIDWFSQLFRTGKFTNTIGGFELDREPIMHTDNYLIRISVICGAMLFFWLVTVYMQDMLVAKVYMWLQKKWNLLWHNDDLTDADVDETMKETKKQQQEIELTSMSNLNSM